MEANQIAGSKDNPLPASTGHAVIRMETPIKLFIQWWQLGTVLCFVPGICISSVYILFPDRSLLSADVWLKSSPEGGVWFTNTHNWKATWPWHNDGSCAVHSTARAQTCQTSHEGHGQGLPPALLFLAQPGRKATAFVPAAQSSCLALPCTSVPGLYKEKVMAEMGTNQGPCMPRKPSKSVQQSPTRVMSIIWQSTAAQCTAALACQGAQLRGRRWREGICLQCHTDLLWVRLCIVQGLIQCLFLQPDCDGWEWRIRAFQEQKKPHAFQVSSGGGNFPLSFP